MSKIQGTDKRHSGEAVTLDVAGLTATRCHSYDTQTCCGVMVAGVHLPREYATAPRHETGSLDKFGILRNLRIGLPVDM